MAQNVFDALGMANQMATSINPFAKAAGAYELAAKKYTTSPLGNTPLTTSNSDILNRIVTKVANATQTKPTPTTSSQTKTTPVVNNNKPAASDGVNRTPIDWSKVAGVPNINNPDVISNEPTASELEASRSQGVTAQNNDHALLMDSIDRSNFNNAIDLANARKNVNDTTIAQATSLINGGTLAGLIQGQALLDAAKTGQASNIASEQTQLGALVNSEKARADAKTQGMSGLAQLLNAQNEQAMIGPKISLMEAQSRLAGNQGNLAATEANFYPQNLMLKNQQIANEQSDKNIDHQNKLLENAVKMSEMEMMANPAKKDEILKKNVMALLNQMK